MNILNNIKDKIKSENIGHIIDKIRTDKKPLIILLSVLIGVLMIAGSEAFDGKGEDNDILHSEEVKNEDTEKRLADIIGNIKGVGKVEVYITYDSQFESVFAVNSDVKTDGDEIHTKNEYIITDEDTGLILKRLYPRIRGVAIVCQGADDPVVKEKIYSAVSALFDISSNRISVADME